MIKLRLKFSKLGRGQYISHLDLLRTFTRSIVRAALPVEYSQGFSPHQLITFALPLPVGVTSETEFVDIEWRDGTTPGEIKEKLILPPDLKILDVGIPNKKAKDIISAEYKITLSTGGKLDIKKIRKFFMQKEVIVSKRSKRSVQNVNLMEFIHDAEIVNATEKEVTLRLVLSAGNEKNLKPDLVVNTLEEQVLNSPFDHMAIHRTNVFCENDNKIENFS